MSLQELFAGRNLDIPAMMQRLKSVAADLDLPLGERTKTFNSRLAQELAKWAETQDRGDAFHMAVFRAYFVDGRNIGKEEVLVNLAEKAGLSAEEARKVLKSRTFRQAVDQDWSLAHQMGITAVPTFVFNRQMLVGAQPYETLAQFIDQARGK